MSKAGRPQVGPVLTLAIEPGVIDALDLNASLVGVSRAELIRSFIKDGLARLEATRSHA